MYIHSWYEIVMVYVPEFLYIEEALQWRRNNKHKQTKILALLEKQPLSTTKGIRKCNPQRLIWQDGRWPKNQVGYFSLDYLPKSEMLQSST